MHEPRVMLPQSGGTRAEWLIMAQLSARGKRFTFPMSATSGNAAEPALPSQDVAQALAEAHAAWQRGDRAHAFELLSALAQVHFVLHAR